MVQGDSISSTHFSYYSLGACFVWETDFPPQ